MSINFERGNLRLTIVTILFLTSCFWKIWGWHCWVCALTTKKGRRQIFFKIQDIVGTLKTVEKSIYFPRIFFLMTFLCPEVAILIRYELLKPRMQKKIWVSCWTCTWIHSSFPKFTISKWKLTVLRGNIGLVKRWYCSRGAMAKHYLIFILLKNRYIQFRSIIPQPL